MYTDGTSWWNLRIPSSRKCINVYFNALAICLTVGAVMLGLLRKPVESKVVTIV